MEGNPWGVVLDVVKATGLPLAEGLNSALDLPHTITFAVSYRNTIDSFNELPKDKRPPRNLWDKPWRLSQYLETVFDVDRSDTKKSEFINFDEEEVE